MGTAILLGIPNAYSRRLSKALESRRELLTGWSLKFVTAPKNAAEINTGLVNQSCNLASQNTDPHIFGFSTQGRRSDLVAVLETCFRFRWCDELVKRFASLSAPDPAPFLDRLALELQEEKEWRSRVKPSDTGSPLLLPECSFRVGSNHRDLWRHARSYGDQANIEGAARAIQRFERSYFRKADQYQWIDDRDLIFGSNGPRHADAPFPRAWKFSFRMPDGFHYDIRHLEKRRFSIADCVGTSHNLAANGYINMDPHGYVRGNL